MTIPAFSVSPTDAAGAYARAGSAFTTATTGSSFGSALQQALNGVVASGKAADSQATQAILGQGNLTDVVTAVSQAELALQSAMAIRDRVVQAYQDVMRMPI